VTLFRLLLLSTTTGYQLRSFGEAADALGVDLVFATDRCHTLDDPWRDGAIAVRFHEEDAAVDAIAAAAAERPLNGIIAVGDRPVVLAARAAAALGLPGTPPDAAAASANKRISRERLGRAGLRIPAILPLTTGADIASVAGSVRYPVVIKPVALSGSRGVIRADSAGELIAAFRRVSALLARPEIRAQRSGLDDQLLIESFIPGHEYAIEGVLTRGRFTPFAIFDKPDPLDGPFFEERIYVTPPPLLEGARQAILDTVQQAAAALGLVHGPIHAECRVNAEGVYLLEIAARPIGGLCSRVLRFQDSGARRSLEHVLLVHACGGDVSRFSREPAAAAVMMIPIPARGTFRTVDGEDEARAVPFVEDLRITAKRDQLLEPLPEAGSYLGFIFAHAPEAAQAEAAVRDAHARLRFTITPAIDVARST
jgi:biotin carboxylase